MIIKPLRRSGSSTVERECIGDVRQSARNLNPMYHPMQRAREYTRAVTAAKMERMFSHPLIPGNLEHRDSVTVTCSSRRSLVPFVSGCADGTIKIWDLPSRKAIADISTAHSKQVTGLTFAVNGQHFYSCSTDGYIHQWSIHQQQQQHKEQEQIQQQQPESSNSSGQDRKSFQKNRKSRTSTTTSAMDDSLASSSAAASLHGPMNSWRSSSGCSFQSLDHHWIETDQFASASDEAVQIWSCHRSTPISTFKHLFGAHDTVTKVKFHPVERHVLINLSADRGIGLHDTRTNHALKKTILRMNSNDVDWNPMEPMNFVVANEDYNAYTFDLRKLQEPTRIYKGHTGAVLSVSWSPTGREFVTGSYDKTMRIYDSTKHGHSRDVYHTKRMQHVFTVNYTADQRFIISGSDDTNLRLWKSSAHQVLKQTTIREENSIRYRQALIQKYQHVPTVSKIIKNRKIPTVIRKQTQQAVIQKESQERKQSNRVKHDKTGLKHQFTSERKKVVVKEVL